MNIFSKSKWHYGWNEKRKEEENINRGEGGATKPFFIHFLLFFSFNMCECVFISNVFFWSRKRKKRNQLNQIFVTENWINVYFDMSKYVTASQRERDRGVCRKPQVIFYEINSISIACCFFVYDVRKTYVGLSLFQILHRRQFGTTHSKIISGCFDYANKKYACYSINFYHVCLTLEIITHISHNNSNCTNDDDDVEWDLRREKASANNVKNLVIADIDRPKSELKYSQNLC